MKFSANKKILGIDIGAKTTKIAQLSFSGGKAKLERCALAETGFLDENFLTQIKNFLSENKVRGLPAAASFDDPSMIIRKMELPKMPDPDLREAIRWNLRDLVESDLSEYTVTYSLLEEVSTDGENVTLRIVAYAVRRQAILDFRAQIEKMGLTPRMIEPEAVTLAAILDRCEEPDEEFAAGVDIGYNHTVFYVVGKRSFVFSRPIRGVDFSGYEKDTLEFPQKLAIEVQKSIDTFQVNFEMQHIGKLYLSGDGELIQDLDAYLEVNMVMKTTFLNPFKIVTGADGFANLRPQLFAKAIGLAYAQL